MRTKTAMVRSRGRGSAGRDHSNDAIWNVNIDPNIWNVAGFILTASGLNSVKRVLEEFGKQIERTRIAF